MQGRSWMAALTLAAALGSPTSALAGDPPAHKTPSVTAPPAATADTHSVRLDLWIRGLETRGCDVEIKPGHPGCKFSPQVRHVSAEGKLKLELNDVEIKNADRDCTFAITIREPGQSELTTYRGLRLSAPGDKATLAVLPCYLSSPSRVAKAGGDSSTTKR